jgi:DnaJ-class molecular chaperone
MSARWIICSRCQGEGVSSAYLGAITAEDWAHDWDPEEQEAYIRGDYDRPCDRCNGEGKVRDEPPDVAWESERRLREQESGEWGGP